MTLLVNKDYISEGYEYSKKETEKGDIYTSNWDGLLIELEKENTGANMIISNLDNTYYIHIADSKWKNCESKIINKFIQSYSDYAVFIKKKYPKKTDVAIFNTIENIPDNCSESN